MTDHMDDLLRDTLETQAQGYEPAGDGLSRIRSRVEARRMRLRWLVPAVALACTVAAVGGVLAAPHLFLPRHGVAPVAGNSSPKPAPTGAGVSPSPNASAAGLPNITTLWPYQSRATAAAKEPADVASGALPYLSDPKATALHFVADYVGVSDPLQVLNTNALEAGIGVRLGRTNPNGQPFEVTTIYLVKVNRDKDAPYVVVRADGPDLRITDVSPGPRPGAITVTGRVAGVDESVLVRLLAADGHVAVFAPPATAGPVLPWKAVLDGASGVPAGQFAVTAQTQSAADGKISQLVVRPYPPG